MVVAQVSSLTQTGEGERFGRYVLLERIGLGGMAEVFRAVANGVEGFARVFVIKRILKEKSTSKTFIDMFVSEARVSALLNHPNIVQIYDFGQVDGSYFLSMEYLRGKDMLSVLRQMRTTGKLMDPAIAAYITQQVAHGLHFAHSLTHSGGQSLNIVHRDVSPSNVMLLRAGGVKLLDFGIAKVGEQLQDQADTKAGIIKGKLSYLSPEQVQGKEIDFRSDIFSLGVMFWEMLTGKRLFYESTDLETMKNVLEKPIIPPSMRRVDAPTALDYIVVRALERDPARRYGSAKELAEEVEAYLADVRFAPGAVPRLLDELFGEDAGIHESLVPNVSITGPHGAVTDDLGAGSLSSLSVQPIPIDRTGGDRQTRPLPIAAGSGRKVGVLLGVSGALAAAAVAFVVMRSPAPSGSSVATSATPTAASSAVGAPTPVSAAAAPAIPAPGTVSIRFETVPRGAEVLAPDGKLLGTTPTTFALPRSTQAIAIVVRRKGFSESRHEIIPDRDLSALLTLIVDRKNRRPGAAPAAKLEIVEVAPPEPAPAPPAGEGVAPVEAVTPTPGDNAPPPPPVPGPDPAQEAPKVDPFKDDTKSNGAPAPVQAP